jgi:hypothetical protein
VSDATVFGRVGALRPPDAAARRPYLTRLQKLLEQPMVRRL